MLCLCSFYDTDISANLRCKSDYLYLLYFQASLLDIMKVEVADLLPSLSHPCPRMSVTQVQRQQVRNEGGGELRLRGAVVVSSCIALCQG